MFDSFRIGYPVSGFAIGVLVGLTGVGGGSLMTPLLIVVFGMKTMGAVGVDLLFAAVTKAVGTAIHGKLRTVDWPVTGRMLLGSMPMTVVTLGLLAMVGPPSPAVNRGATTALGAALILTAASVALRPQILALGQRLVGAGAAQHSFMLTVVLGMVLGVLVPITSVGAAALGMPVLLLLYPARPTAQLVGADIAHAVPLTLVAGIGHLLVGTIDVGLLASLLAGSIPGIALGSLLAGRVPDQALRYLMAIALILAGWKLLA